jgi:hypothetical protein
VIAYDELLMLNEANYGRKKAIKRMAEKVAVDSEATVTISVYIYLQALQLVVDDVDKMLKLINSMTNGLDIIRDNFPSGTTESIIEAMEKKPDCYFHELPRVYDPDNEPCCGGCAEGQGCNDEEVTDGK